MVLGVMSSKKQVKCELLAVRSHEFLIFNLALNDFSANKKVVKVTYKSFCFAGNLL